jgi:hypothetical protein
MARVATLAEIERDWSVDDLVLANLALSVHQAMQGTP